VYPDGATDVPQLRVDAVLYGAAAKVADGELVPEPVREGERFAAVWRRGSLPAVDRPLASEAPAIRGILERERVVAARTALLERLRREHAPEVHADLLEQLPMSSSAPPRPEQTPEPRASSTASDPAPKPGPTGLR
jgi:peptidyl-prolyl cis-trans isomerase C